MRCGILTRKKLRLAVLVSGGGTNLQAMIDRSGAGALKAEIVVVLSDRPDAFGLERASMANIPAFHVDYKSIPKLAAADLEKLDLPVDPADLDRRQKIVRNPDPVERRSRLARLVLAERELIRIIDSFQPDYICLAGFMRLVTPYFINHFNAGGLKILNIHPALLPSFPGQHGYEETLQYGCKWGGITVHFVDEGEDTGPIIAQTVYPIRPGDDIGKIRERGLLLEYELYSQVINWLAQGYVLLKSSPGGRTRVEITDPNYGAILAGWIEKATVGRDVSS
ncbi:Phosphoribosylglycinamide formyltransferase [Syntrophobacter sp. SbD1]|nr:Phosphoribosylglycinamide formyltransferase [Syntrophobacter sp. SbD1]